MRAVALLALAILLLAAVPAAADSGTLVLDPEEVGEVEVPARRTGERIAYQWNVTPPGAVVEFNVHYLFNGLQVYRAKANLTSLETTIFAIRAQTYYLQYKNWGDEPLRVAWEWHYVRPLTAPREVAAPGLLAVAGTLGAVALAARRLP